MFELAGGTIKLLGIYFFWNNKKLKREKSFLSQNAQIQNILKLQKLRNLTIDGRIV